MPVAQARFMRSRLAAFHGNFAYYEKPAAEHFLGQRQLRLAADDGVLRSDGAARAGRAMPSTSRPPIQAFPATAIGSRSRPSRSRSS